VSCVPRACAQAGSHFLTEIVPTTRISRALEVAAVASADAAYDSCKLAEVFRPVRDRCELASGTTLWCLSNRGQFPLCRIAVGVSHLSTQEAG
jgi:hypothetical protein